MPDTYPWGAQAPQARLSKLQRQLKSSETAREKYLTTHREKIAKFDEADRQTKSEIRQCEQIMEKERTEANAASVTRLMMKLLGGTSPELVEKAIKNGTLEERLEALASTLEPAPEDKAETKKSKSPKSTPSAEA